MAAKAINTVIIAEAQILNSQVPECPDPNLFKEWITAISSVHGWKLVKATDKLAVIKAPDISKMIKVPASSMSAENKLKFEGMGFTILYFNNAYYVRHPEGLPFPALSVPKQLKYTINISKFDSDDLEDMGLSVDVLAGIQNDYINFLTRFTLVDLITGDIPSATNQAYAFNSLNGIKLTKIKKSYIGRWSINLDGNNISPTLWKEEQTKVILIENRNVDDARVSTDTETVEAGRAVSIEPLGANIYRVELSDTTVDDDLNVTGLTYSGDVFIKDGKATWYYSGKVKTKKRGFLSRGHEITDTYHIITLQVSTNSGIPRAQLSKLP